MEIEPENYDEHVDPGQTDPHYSDVKYGKDDPSKPRSRPKLNRSNLDERLDAEAMQTLGRSDP